MRCLIRYISRKGRNVVHDDHEFQGDALTVGRGADNDIALDDIYLTRSHAKISSAGKGKAKVEATSDAAIYVNDKAVRSATLSVGDSVAFGGTRVEVLAPEGSHELMLGVEVGKPGPEIISDRLLKSHLTLEDAGMRRRGWSWGLFLVFTMAFLVLPLAGFFSEPLREPLRSVAVVSDISWDSGDLASAHHAIGDDCNACHQQPFTMVRDIACIECHSETLQHADPEFNDLEELTGTRCATCHKEHNGDTHIVRKDQSLCVDCHGSLTTMAQGTDLLDVRDFGDAHPEFRVSLIHSEDGSDEITRVSLSNKKELKERSGLIFNHEVHLEEEGLRTSDGMVKLDCVSCHAPEPGGAGMLPIDMKTMCQDCHQLGFDPNAPDTDVPHGRVDRVLETLQGYYAKVALEGGYLDEEAPDIVNQRRRPGRKLTKLERKEALEWAEEKWRTVAEELVEFRTCVTCHELDRISDDPPNWDVKPVRVADIWMPKAQFTHKSHTTMVCQDCHAEADTSVESSDVMIPDLESCRECHGGESASNRLQSTCDDCHGFHIYEHAVMGNEK